MKSTSSALGVVFKLVVVVLLDAVVGCASNDKTPLYVQSEEISDLRVPAGLDQPPARSDYEVPGYFLPELAASRDVGRPPQVQTSAEAEASMAQIRFGAKGLHLEVEADQASVSEELTYILDHEEVGLILRAVDISDHRFEFAYRHQSFVVPRSGFARLAIWRDVEIVDYSGQFILEVVAIGQSRSRIVLLDGQGDVVSMEQAEHILAMLREALG
jgi:uncharacterized lipoprotein